MSKRVRKVTAGGGWPSIWYSLRQGRRAGGIWKLWKALRSKNACKTCAVGMGGQRGGMVNERGSFPEVCKKSIQAMTADMQGAIPEDFWSTYSLEQLKSFTPYQMEHAGRLVQPVRHIRGTSYYQPISWDEALNRIVSRLKETVPDRSFWYFSGRSSNEAAFALQLFARIFGTNHVNNCSYYCHQASGVGLTSSVGSGTATIVLDDVEHADLVFLMGANPASNHPRLMSTLTHIRRRGGKVIVINPVVETGLVNFKLPSHPISLLFGTKIATQYVQPHIGGDLALLTGIAKRIDELGASDQEFMRQHCDGYEKWIGDLRAFNWDEIEDKSGVTREEISSIAETYGAAKNVVFSWTMGITHHCHGVQNVQAIANLALMRGMVGRPHAGLMPIRGHSNVQGIGSIGVTPKLKDAIFRRLESHFGVNLPTTRGLDTLSCMEAASRGDMELGFCLGGNLFGSNPDARFAAEALSQPKLLVYVNTTLNTGHAHATAEETIILPVLARDEEPSKTTQESMFNFVRLSDGGKPRHPGPRSELDVIADIASRVADHQNAVDFNAMRSSREIRQVISKVIPGWEKLGEIDETNEEFQIGGRTFHEPVFPTPSGKAHLNCHKLPPLKGGDDRLRLMTVRSEGQFNTVVYEEHDLYRGQERRDVILVHPDDLARRGLEDDQPVVVRSDTGQLSNIRARAFPEIRAGNALMYYPEANVLVARRADAKSKTPAFKGEVVTVQPM